MKHKIKFYLIKLLVTSFAVLFTAWLLKKGIHIEEPRIYTAIIVGITLILLNTFLKPILIAMTIPLTLFSFGFFLLIINALVIELIDFLLGGFRVDSFMWALLFGMLVSIISSVIEAMGSVQVVRFNSHGKSSSKNDDDDDEFTPYEEV
ncbi:MAG: phage holin family protein [Bacteroidales bacterium]|jgi:putative membrane protein|nr:phage holin family protein [Bacteroidales bacterium]MDD2687732.1 phage holin family protein [Bacteroidales bacterium]MDD3330295.1 phage holin family protein [Bacteroidales bacterium]MDD3690973.1 phage holin family protein [Bacteroidales bacterium]MDD4044360.1 phage holin family protein [Bacteroidales bacterium]